MDLNTNTDSEESVDYNNVTKNAEDNDDTELQISNNLASIYFEEEQKRLEMSRVKEVDDSDFKGRFRSTFKSLLAKASKQSADQKTNFKSIELLFPGLAEKLTAMSESEITTENLSSNSQLETTTIDDSTGIKNLQEVEQVLLQDYKSFENLCNVLAKNEEIDDKSEITAKHLLRYDERHATFRRRLPEEILDGTEFAINDYQPIICPFSMCPEKLLFITTYCKHLRNCHRHLVFETIAPGQKRHFLVSYKTTQKNINKVAALYLVTDKVQDLGKSMFKDYLPVTLMVTKVEVTTRREHDEEKSLVADTENGNQITENKNFFMLIWLTGPCDENNIRIFATLSLISKKKNSRQQINSGALYPIIEDQSPKEVFKSGKGIFLSAEECEQASLDRKHIELEITIL